MNFVAWDIETDTSGGGGLDPTVAGVVSIAAAVYRSTPTGLTEHEVFYDAVAGPSPISEAALLVAFDRWLAARALRDEDMTHLVGWNSAVFDAPFVARRSEILRTEIDLYLSFAPEIVPKYEPLPGFAGGYHHRWYGLRSRDQAYGRFNRGWCEAAGINWRLKDVAEHHGLDPVRVDRENIHLLSGSELAAYNLSDVRMTAALTAAAMGFPFEMRQR